jgi:hypothetical protein
LAAELFVHQSAGFGVRGSARCWAWSMVEGGIVIDLDVGDVGENAVIP